MHRATLVGLLLALLMSVTVHAQTQNQDSAQSPQPGSGSEQTDDNSDQPAEQPEAASDLPDIDSQPIQAGSGGPGRFIPSEQISQDSGVSFPVDI